MLQKYMAFFIFGPSNYFLLIINCILLQPKMHFKTNSNFQASEYTKKSPQEEKKKSPNLTFAISLDQLQMFSGLYKNLDVLNLTLWVFPPALIGTVSNLSAKTLCEFHMQFPGWFPRQLQFLSDRSSSEKSRLLPNAADRKSDLDRNPSNTQTMGWLTCHA